MKALFGMARAFQIAAFDIDADVPTVKLMQTAALAPLLGCSREQRAAADLQCQNHLRTNVSCIGAQRRERHAEEPNSFAHRKLRRE